MIKYKLAEEYLLFDDLIQPSPSTVHAVVTSPLNQSVGVRHLRDMTQ